MARSLRALLGINPGRLLPSPRDGRRWPKPACPRPSTRALVLGLCFVVLTAAVPLTSSPVEAAEMDKKGRSDAKTAMRFYKQGNYEDAAKVFLRLSIDYPDMLVFVRNLGACYYYMRRYEPALSNLRDYEHRKKDIAPDDRAEIAGWIGEMERLRDQAAAAAAVPPPAPAVPTAPPDSAVAPVVAPPLPSVTPSASETTTAAPPSLAAPLSPEVATPPLGQPSEDATQQAPLEGQPGPAYPQGQYGSPSQPAYPPGQYGPPTYPQGQYGAQPTYPQGQYGPQPAYPYPPSQGAYPARAYQPAGVAVPASSPQAGGGGRKTAVWILALAGVGGIAAGGIFTALTLDRFSKVQKKYDPAVEKEGKRFAIYQWVGYGSGAALLTTAIIVGASGGSSMPRVAVAPAVGPGVAGAALSGSF